VKLNAIIQHKFFKPAVGAGLAILCGLVLWDSPLGERWANASYDYIFRFGARPVTNQVALILMDNDAYAHYRQVREPPSWNRALHAELLKKLADDGCALVILDTFFRAPREPDSDLALAAALRRQRGVVLMAKQTESEHQKPEQKLESVAPLLPEENLLAATGTNWGVAWLDDDLDGIVRRHWPFPSPGPHPSLPWAAATMAGARLSEAPRERWLRYYGERGQWTSLSYHFAMGQATNYFRDKIVFIGSKPESSSPDGEEDEFSTPYTRWTGESMGGVEIQAAAFLNLLNDEWLRRPAGWVEALIFIVAGALSGACLCRLRPLLAIGIAIGASLAVTLATVSWSYGTNYWFPWLVIAGGQVPCALAWAFASGWIRPYKTIPVTEVLAPSRILPDAPDYQVIDPPFGQGAYGRVWLVRNAVGQWQALKAVYQDLFGENTAPFERELRGIEHYKPVSDKHPGLLRVDFVSRKKPEGYFYYVMELGDAQTPGWEENPLTYRPRDLASVRAQAERGRLPAQECVHIALPLAEALDFLHRQDLTHRDIKPQNIVFVNGRPKLADVGLVADVQPSDRESTYVGTPGYMPPLPEPPGTPQADIYGLGMVLYVISTGRDPVLFPELSATLVDASDSADFIRLNAIILKACQPDRAQRYASAAEMVEALRNAKELMSGARSA